MSPEEVKQLVENAIPGAEVEVTSPDGSHFSLTVISDSFEGLSTLKRQQAVNGALFEPITSGAIHALDTINAYTADEWQKASKLQIS